MKVERTLFCFEGDTITDMKRADTIKWEGRLWLVPAWIDNLKTQTSRPERIVCLDLLEHQDGGPPGVDYTLSRPIPRCVWDGQAPPGTKGGYLIVEDPPIQVPTQEILFREP